MPRTDKQVEGKSLDSVIAAEIADSQAYGRIETENRRARNLEYIQGVMTDVQQIPNRSKLVSSDVRDVISWMHPSLMRVFTSSSQIVEFEAVEEGQDQWARDATDFMNYDFMRNNPGYQIIYNATWDALAQSNGLVCSYWKPAETSRETLRGLTLEQIAMLAEDPAFVKDDTGMVKISSQKPAGMVMVQSEYTNPDGSVMLVEAEQRVFDVRIERITKKAHIADETLKPENLFLNDMATTIEDARFCAYLFDNYTRSDLIQMADAYDFSVEDIEELPNYGQEPMNPVDQARFRDTIRNRDSATKSGDYIDLYRCFVKVDVDDDGIAEQLEVWYAGNGGSGKVLSWSIWEGDIPYTDIPCFPIPHRFDGESAADRSADIQKVKTVLLRATADNLYASNMPMREVEAGTVLNPDILVAPKFGGIVWRKLGSMATAPVRDLSVPFFAEKSLAAMAYFDEALAKRTGISRSTMALDPEALRNQTATGVQQQRDAGYTQVEIVARNMAEFGWARFFKKRLNLAIKYQEVASIPDKMGEDGQQPFRQVQPKGSWPPNMACTVNVGLGTGSKDRDMAMLNTVLGVQVSIAEKLAGIPGLEMKAGEFIPKIINTAIKLTESAGLKNPDGYFVSVGPEDLQRAQQALERRSQQPNPQMQIEQAKLEAQKERDMGQMQIDTAKAQMQGQLEQQKLIGNAELERQKSEQQAALERERMDREFALKTYQIDRELQLKERQLVAELALKERLAIMTASLNNQANTVNGNRVNASSEVNVGGDPG